MSVILLVVGILITAAGVAAIGFGIPTNESAVGQTLIIAGATGLVGGPILVGLAAALSQLSLIVAALKGKPVAARPAEAKQPAAAEVRRKVEVPAVAEPRVPEPRLPVPEPRVVVDPRPPEPRVVAEPRPVEPRPAEPRAPEPAPTIDVSASAIERLRSTMPRPDRVVTQVEEVPLSPNGSGHPPDPLPESRPSTTVEAREPRLDFLFRSRTPRPPQAESFDSMWPKRGGGR